MINDFSSQIYKLIFILPSKVKKETEVVLRFELYVRKFIPPQPRAGCGAIGYMDNTNH